MFKNVFEKPIQTEGLAKWGIINYPGNWKIAHSVLLIQKNALLKKTYILECRTNTGTGKEFEICEEALRPSHSHKAQLAILRSIPEKKQTTIYSASGEKIKTIVIPLKTNTPFFNEMQAGWEEKQAEINLNLAKKLSTNMLVADSDPITIESFLKYQKVCSSILVEKERLKMSSKELSDFKNNVFSTASSNENLEQISLQELDSSDIIETLIRNSS